MKFFVTILSFFFLVLTVLPCEDNVVEQTNASEEVHCLEKDCDGGSKDLCSPFCQQCHCCQVHVTNLQAADVLIYNPEIFSNLFACFEGFGEEVLISHFQPPRV